MEDRIEFLHGSFFDLLPKLRGDVVFLSPPWGGVDYAASPRFFDLERDMPFNGVALYRHALALTPNVVYYLPKNTQREHVALLAPLTPCDCGDVHACVRPLPPLNAVSGDAASATAGDVPAQTLPQPLPQPQQQSQLGVVASQHILIHGYWPSSASASAPAAGGAEFVAAPVVATACGPCEAVESTFPADNPCFRPSLDWGDGTALVLPFAYAWARHFLLAHAPAMAGARQDDGCQDDGRGDDQRALLAQVAQAAGAGEFYRDYARIVRQHYPKPARKPAAAAALSAAAAALSAASVSDSSSAGATGSESGAVAAAAAAPTLSPWARALPSLPNPFLLLLPWDPRSAVGTAFRAYMGRAGAEAAAWHHAWVNLFHVLLALRTATANASATATRSVDGADGDDDEAAQRGSNGDSGSGSGDEDEGEDIAGPATKRARPASASSAHARARPAEMDWGGATFDDSALLRAVLHTPEAPRVPLQTLAKYLDRASKTAAQAAAHLHRRRSAGQGDEEEGDDGDDDGHTSLFSDGLASLGDGAGGLAAASDARAPAPWSDWSALVTATLRSPLLRALLRRLFEDALAYERAARLRLPQWGHSADRERQWATLEPLARAVADGTAPSVPPPSSLTRPRSAQPQQPQDKAAAGGSAGGCEHPSESAQAQSPHVYSITMPVADRAPATCGAHTHAPVPTATAHSAAAAAAAAAESAEAADGIDTGSDEWNKHGWRWGCDIETACFNGSAKAVIGYFGVLAQAVPLQSMRDG